MSDGDLGSCRSQNLVDSTLQLEQFGFRAPLF
jgi:hypothetical protein